MQDHYRHHPVTKPPEDHMLVMSEDHLPLTGTHGLPRIQTEVPMPPGNVAPLPRPREDEPKPFNASRAPEWLIAYA